MQALHRQPLGQFVVGRGLGHSSSVVASGACASGPSSSLGSGATDEAVPIDGVATLIDQFDVLGEPFEGLAGAQIGAYRRDLPVAFELLADLGRLLPDPLGDRGVLVLELLVGDLELLGDGDGPQGEVDLDALGGGLAQLGDERLLVLAGLGEVLLDADALGLEPHGEVLEALLHLLVHERLGDVVVDQLGEGLGGLLLHGHGGLHLLDHAEALLEVGAQLVDGLELGGLGGELVVGLGEDLLLDVLDLDRGSRPGPRRASGGRR